jgi:F0F1-type ATP synthase assembly protein I
MAVSNDHVGRSHVKEELPSAGYAPAPLAMNNSVGLGRRLVLRVVLLQLGCAACGATLFGCVLGMAAAGAALLGGLIVAIGSALFGWRLFAPGIAPASVLRRALFAAESLKWFWYVLALWVALARLKVQPLPLMSGLVFTQFGYWVGMVGMKRPQQ